MKLPIFKRPTLLLFALLVGALVLSRAPLAPVATPAKAQEAVPVAPQNPLPRSGSLWVHDPSRIIKSGDNYFVFYTGDNVRVRSSTDAKTWKDAPPVFEKVPDWIQTAVPAHKGNNLWAPDILFFGNKFWLFYSASTFGARVSAIGVATNTTLDATDPAYKWNDGGMVIASTRTSGWNAIDPAPIVTENGELWLSFGSFGRGGIQLVKLDSTSGKAVGTPTTLAAGQRVGPEAPYLYFHGGWIYLFENEGFCCRGLNSTYQIMMGRSKTLAGPYLDKQGRDLAKGGGTVFLRTQGEEIGPGHMGIWSEKNRDHFSFHFYGSLVNGVPTLGVQTLVWDEDGWPRPATQLVPGRYHIVSKASGLALGVAQISEADGAPLDQFKLDGGPFQTWNFAPVGDGFFAISSLATGKFVDLAGCSPANGTKISQYPWFGNDCQKWRVEPTSNGAFRILSKSTGNAITLPNGDKAPLAVVQSFAPTGGVEQEWELRPAQ